jgi:hypothetical protein
MKYKEVFDIAANVRNAAVKHPDSFYSLGCWCAICSFHIYKKIKSKNRKVFFAMVNKEGEGSHCFVIFDKKKMVDVTATQFGEKENIIIDEVENLQRSKKWFWNKKLMKKYKSVKAIKRALEEWPEDQNPFRVDFSC